jgi:hypothetical protein
VQHIAERNRIKQRIIRLEVTLHLLPKIPGSRETGESFHTTPESVLRHLFVRVRTPERRLAASILAPFHRVATLIKTMSRRRELCIEIKD